MGIFSDIFDGLRDIKYELDDIADAVKDSVSDIKDTLVEAAEDKIEDVKDYIEDIDWDQKASQISSTANEIRIGMEGVGDALQYAGRDISGAVLGYENESYSIPHFDDEDSDINVDDGDDYDNDYSEDYSLATKYRTNGEYSAAISILESINSQASSNEDWENAYKSIRKYLAVLKECSIKAPETIDANYMEHLKEYAKLREYEAMLYTGKNSTAETYLSLMVKHDESDAEHAAAILAKYYKTTHNKSQYRYWYNLGVKKWGYEDDNEWDYERWL